MPLFTAIATAATATAAFFGAGAAAAAAIGTFASQIVVGTTLNLIGSAIRGKPRVEPPAITGQARTGGTQDRSFVLGTAAVDGSLAFHNGYRFAGQGYYTKVVALTDLPVRGLKDVIIDGRVVTLDTANENAQGSPVLEYQVDGVDYLWIKFYDGTQTAVDNFVQANATTAERPWTGKFIGCAYAVIHARFNQDLFNQFPSATFIIDGYPLAGPTGNTATESVRSSNPVAMIYELVKGISFNGVPFYGFQGVAPIRLDDALWNAKFDKCNIPVPGAAGMTDAERVNAFGNILIPEQYKCGGEISVTSRIVDVLELISDSCNARFLDAGWKFEIEVGDPEASSFTLTDDDIDITYPQNHEPFVGLANKINHVVSTYPEPRQNWQAATAPAVGNATFETDDGNRRLGVTVSYPMVPYGEQVQRLGAATLAEARLARTHTFTVGREFNDRAKVNRVFEWDSLRNGYIDKEFRIDGRSDLVNGDILLTVKETDNTAYSWDVVAQYKDVLLTGESFQAFEGIEPATNLLFSEPEPTAASEQFKKFLRVSFDASASSFVSHYIVKWTVNGATQARNIGVQTQHDIYGLVPGDSVDVEITAYNIVDRKSTVLAGTHVFIGRSALVAQTTISFVGLATQGIGTVLPNFFDNQGEFALELARITFDAPRSDLFVLYDMNLRAGPNHRTLFALNPPGTFGYADLNEMDNAAINIAEAPYQANNNAPGPPIGKMVASSGAFRITGLTVGQTYRLYMINRHDYGLYTPFGGTQSAAPDYNQGGSMTIHEALN